MSWIIPFDKTYEFAFLEEALDKKTSPVSNYFLKLEDLSINLVITLKWIMWGYEFLKLTSENLKNIDKEAYLNEKVLTQLRLFENIEHNLLIDNNQIKNNSDLENLIKNLYNNQIFNENTKIQLKLKINLDEFLILSNCLFPTLIEFGEMKIL